MFSIVSGHITVSETIQDGHTVNIDYDGEEYDL